MTGAVDPAQDGVGRLAHLFRYPVKSIGGEELAEVSLTAGAPLPGDRRFAVLHEAAVQHLDGAELRRWLPKSAFVRGVAAASLMKASCRSLSCLRQVERDAVDRRVLDDARDRRVRAGLGAAARPVGH